MHIRIQVYKWLSKWLNSRMPFPYRYVFVSYSDFVRSILIPIKSILVKCILIPRLLVPYYCDMNDHIHIQYQCSVLKYKVYVYDKQRGSSSLSSRFVPNTHKLYILRHCINIVFILQKNHFIPLSLYFE